MEAIKVFGIVGGIILIIWILSLWQKKYGDVENHIDKIKDNLNSWGEGGENCSSCSCGEDECSSKKSSSKAIIYYDDEELDRFAGRKHSEYNEEEIEEFREIFTTLLPKDVEGWLYSLSQRHIALPTALIGEVQKQITQTSL